MAKPRFHDRQEFKAWNEAMAEKYDLEKFHRHPSPLVRYVETKRVRRIFALLKPGAAERILEVGCGAGHLLARLPVARPFGLDLSDRLLAKASRRLGGRGILIQADAEHLPFRDGVWDRVYCSEVLEHLPEPGAVLAEIGRVLGSPGVAVVSIPNERLINALKAVLHKAGLYKLFLRAGASDYPMPERMDDEWHLHSFSLPGLLGLVPSGLRVARLERIPFRWLPLRYIVRLEAAGNEVRSRPVGGAARILSHPWVFDLSQRLLAAGLQPVKRWIDARLGAAPRERVLDACCGTGNFASLAPGDYLGIDGDPAAVRRARRKHGGDRRKRFVVADLTSLDLPPGRFDLALFANGLHHLPEEAAISVLRTLARATRGPVVVVDPAIETGSAASRILLALERGAYLRSIEEQMGLLKQAGLRIEIEEALYSGLAHQRIFLCRGAQGPDDRVGRQKRSGSASGS